MTEIQSLWHFGARYPALHTPLENIPSPSKRSEQFIGTAPQHGRDGCHLLQTHLLRCPCLISGCPISGLDCTLWLLSFLAPSNCCTSYSSSLAPTARFLFLAVYCVWRLMSSKGHLSPVARLPTPVYCTISQSIWISPNPLSAPEELAQANELQPFVSEQSFIQIVLRTVGIPHSGAPFIVR